MVANTDAIQQMDADYDFRSAVSGPPRLIFVIGMWLLFGPLLFAGPLLLFNGIDDGFTLTLASLSLFSAVILYRTTKNYIVKRRSANERRTEPP